MRTTTITALLLVAGSFAAGAAEASHVECGNPSDEVEVPPIPPGPVLLTVFVWNKPNCVGASVESSFIACSDEILHTDVGPATLGVCARRDPDADPPSSSPVDDIGLWVRL